MDQPPSNLSSIETSAQSVLPSSSAIEPAVHVPTDAVKEIESGQLKETESGQKDSSTADVDVENTSQMDVDSSIADAVVVDEMITDKDRPAPPVQEKESKEFSHKDTPAAEENPNESKDVKTRLDISEQKEPEMVPNAQEPAFTESHLESSQAREEPAMDQDEDSKMQDASSSMITIQEATGMELEPVVEVQEKESAQESKPTSTRGSRRSSRRIEKEEQSEQSKSNESLPEALESEISVTQVPNKKGSQKKAPAKKTPTQKEVPAKEEPPKKEEPKKEVSNKRAPPKKAPAKPAKKTPAKGRRTSGRNIALKFTVGSQVAALMKSGEDDITYYLGSIEGADASSGVLF